MSRDAVKENVVLISGKGVPKSEPFLWGERDVPALSGGETTGSGLEMGDIDKRQGRPFALSDKNKRHAELGREFAHRMGRSRRGRNERSVSFHAVLENERGGQ